MIPLPVEPLWSVPVVAELLGRSSRTIHNLLWKHRDAFPRRYGRDGQHPRRVRLLTSEEVRQLATLIQVRGAIPADRGAFPSR